MNATHILMKEALRIKNKIAAGEKVLEMFSRRNDENRQSGLDLIPESRFEEVRLKKEKLENEYDIKMSAIEAIAPYEDYETVVLEYEKVAAAA